MIRPSEKDNGEAIRQQRNAQVRVERTQESQDHVRESGEPSRGKEKHVGLQKHPRNVKNFFSRPARSLRHE